MFVIVRTIVSSSNRDAVSLPNSTLSPIDNPNVSESVTLDHDIVTISYTVSQTIKSSLNKGSLQIKL